MNKTGVGKQFERIVGKLYCEMGYDVELQKKMRGISGNEHTVDIYIHRKSFWRGEKDGIVECKYRDERYSIGKSELADFLLLLDDVHVKEAHMVTNSFFAESALTIADKYNVKLIDGVRLRKLLDKHDLSVYLEQHFPDDPFSYMAKSLFDVAEDAGALKGLPKREGVPASSFVFYDRADNPGKNNNLVDKRPGSPIINEGGRGPLEKFEKNPDIENLFKAERPKIHFDVDIGGLEDVKEEVKVAVIDPIINRRVYEKLHKEAGNVMLYGPPGCGKTLIAKAVATEFEGDFIAPYIHDIMRKYVGESEKYISKIFERCRRSDKPSVIFFDEFDALMPRSGPRYVKRIKNEFLSQLDGLSSRKGFPAVISASNSPWEVAIPIRRPGRFDRLIMVPPPDKIGRKQILRIHMRGLIMDDMVEGDYFDLIEYAAGKTEGWSGADLKGLIDVATDGPLKDYKRAAARGIRPNSVRKVNIEDFNRALTERDSSIKSWFRDAIRSCKRYKENEILKDIVKHFPQGFKKSEKEQGVITSFV